LGHVAELFASSDAVAGYDIMNEPNAFRPADQAGLASLYSDALHAIRAAEQRAGGESHLIFFEPPAIWSTFGMGPPRDFERDDDVVYAPHIYTGGFDGGPITESAFEIAVQEASLFGGAPVLSGEWGSDPRRASDPNDAYFIEHQNLQDRFHIGATLWTWRESCGDPHKAADYRAGRVPYVWGEFDVDCATNEIEGLRHDLLNQLTRGWVRAAPGRLLHVSYDTSTGTLTAHGMAVAAGTSLVAFYPTSRHGFHPPQTTGLEDVDVVLIEGGNHYVIGRALGGEWTLRIGPTL
jgi:endoglycosylceramidase